MFDIYKHAGVPCMYGLFLIVVTLAVGAMAILSGHNRDDGCEGYI